jgi:4-alpha-glucanotransferase
MRDSELRALARLHGIQLSYEDAAGKRREASVETLRAIIDARAESFERARARTREPVVVQWDREPYVYETDDRGVLTICAPRKAHPIEKKTWGLFLPLHAIGGTFRDLRAWHEALGGGIVATLPLLARYGDERSPYSPSSRLQWNEEYGSAEEMRALADSTPLYLDFPLGVHPDGYDVRHYRNSFVKGVSVGAPPDSFFTKGQNWGFPPLDPEAIRDNHHEYFRAAIAHHASHATVLRLDHVMGLHRLYWIPDGADAKDGAYVRYRSEELYAILTVESHRHRCAIVGEDLGTVPPEVPRAMKRHGLRRMFVVQYEVKGEQPPIADPPRESVASVNTHDMPTFAAFWRGLDIDDRVQQGLLDEEGARTARESRARVREAIGGSEREALEKILLLLARSDAEIVLVNPEDLWGETEPQNVPGVPERSWRQTFRRSLEEARADADVRRILGAVSGARLAK